MDTKLARPYVLTPETQKRILDFLAAGNYISTACAAAGVTDDAFYHWRRRWEDGDVVAQQFADFFTKVKQAIALGETNLLSKVDAGEPGWQSKAWIMERRFHKRWGRKDKLTIDRKITDEELRNMTDEELNELRSGKSRR